MRQRLHLPAVSVTTLFLAWATTCAAGSGPLLVELDRWSDRAYLAPNPGPGERDFVLTAEVAWDRSASRDFRNYRVRIVLPNGETILRPLAPDEVAPSPDIRVLVPASALRNLRPERVRVQVAIVDGTSRQAVSNELEATIDDFPTPSSDMPRPDPGPFGWGTPLSVTDGRAALLPQPAVDGFRFVLLPESSSTAATYLATTEATNRQVGERLKGYDPAAGRSDEFSLEAPEQPALNLTPERAQEYLAALTAADPAHLAYRLPTQDEWLKAARAGASSPFWWGDDAANPEGANFLGPEPALRVDSTAPALPPAAAPTFAPNPWGLAHTFGNVAEWATNPSGGFVRLGGHFRTAPASPLPEPEVTDPKSLGDDAYVGVRPTLGISAKAGADAAAALLQKDPRLANVRPQFDPARSTIILTGEVGEAGLRRVADERLKNLWWVAAVENHLTTPTFGVGRLVRLGKPTEPARTVVTLGKAIDFVPFSVRWANPLPVAGSTWWVNFYVPGGGHVAYVMREPRTGRAQTIELAFDQAKLRAAGLVRGQAISVALSLGGEAPSPRDPNVVSNLVSVQTLAR